MYKENLLCYNRFSFCIYAFTSWSINLKLSPETIAILKNFAAINQSIQFRAGSIIKTKSAGADLYATANVAEVFPVNFAIYELGRFLNVMSLFTDPNLDFESESDSVLIGDGNNTVRYVFADASLIKGANYDKEIKLPKTLAIFTLKQEHLAKLQRAASVLGMPTVTIAAKKGNLTVTSHDKKNASSDKFNLSLGPVDAEDFKVEIKLETLRFIPGDYEVVITEQVICTFAHSVTDLTYMVAAEITQ